MILPPEEKQQLIKSLRRVLDFAEGLKTSTECGKCKFMSLHGFCDIWKQQVPDEAREKGCEKFNWDGFPEL